MGSRRIALAARFRGDGRLRRFLALCLAVLTATAPFGAAAQDKTFEELVEDALKRADEPAPPAAVPPATAVPPRIGVPVTPPVTPPPPVTAQPAAPAPAQPTVPAAPAPATPPAPEQPTGPKPYTPPVQAAPAAPATPAPANPPVVVQPSVPAAPVPGTPAVTPPTPAEPARPPERGMAELKVDEVNAATFADDPAAMRGASPLVLKTQILLDRAGASPGVIDSYAGGNVAKAIASVETVLGLPAGREARPGRSGTRSAATPRLPRSSSTRSPPRTRPGRSCRTSPRTMPSRRSCRGSISPARQKCSPSASTWT